MIDKNHKRTADYSRPNYMISLRRQTPTSGTKDQETMQPLPPLPLHPGSFRVRIRRPSNSEGKGAKITERHIDDYLHAYGEAATGLSPEVFEIYPKGVMRVALVRIVDLARTDPYFAGLAFRIRNRSVESGSIPPLRIKKGITERMANDEALESLGKTHLHTEETRKENERTPEEKQKIREQKARSAMDKISGRAPGKPPKTTKIYGDESHEDEGVIGYDAYHDSLIRELYRPIHAMLPSSDFLTEAAYFGSWGWKVLRSWKTMCSGGSWDKKQMLGHLLRCGGLMYPYEIYSLVVIARRGQKSFGKKGVGKDEFSQKTSLYTRRLSP